MNDDTRQQIYRERCSYQIELDERFPVGGICAVLRRKGHRLDPAGLIISTGRLLCSDARREDGNGTWQHQVLIDSRLSDNPIADPVHVWIGPFTPHPEAKGLWEADIFGDPGESKVLRVNAEPPSDIRPTRRMRRAVTRAHEDHLFPGGIEVG